jgi:hypothetical protein
MLRVAAASFALLCAAPSARADGSEAIEGEHRRHGFVARVDFGAGAIGMGDVRAPVSRTLSPIAFSVGLLLGAALTERVVLGVEIAGVGSDDAPLTGTRMDKNRFVLAWLGPHVSFHVLPHDAYLSLGVGMGAVQTHVDDGPLTWSSTGLAGRLGIGKELWVTPHMAFGLAAHLWFGSGRDWSVPAIGLALSVACN